MTAFFDENGLLNLDEDVQKIDSFKTIMEDGVVTDAELKEQAERVTALLHKVEDNCSPKQLAIIKELLAEMNVLFTVYHRKRF